MPATLFLGPHAVSRIQPTLPPPLCIPLLIPIVQSQIGGLRLRAAVPSAIHVLDIEHKTLDLWEGPDGNTEGPRESRGKEEI